LNSDPFFQEAFRDMDEEFGKRFQSHQNTAHVTKREDEDGANSNVIRQAQTGGQGFFPWLMRACGIDLQKTTANV
jgi:hypothetical protein